MELTGTSVITGVVVHARGALVSRRVSPAGPVPEGDVDLVVAGITPLAEGASVRASVRGGKRSVVSVQTALVVPAEPARAAASVERLHAIENQLERLRSEVARLEQRRERLIQLRPTPRFGRSRRDSLDLRFADGVAFAGLVSEVVEASDVRLVELRLEIERVNREQQAAVLEHTQLSTTQKQGTGHPTRQVTIRLAGVGDLGELELNYAVVGARWWPLYTLRLTEGGRRASLALEALVAQRSGEDWSAVALALSTADLLFDAQLTDLPSLHLGRAQPPRRPSYRAPPEGLDRLFVGYDGVFAQRAPPPPAAAPRAGRPTQAPPSPMPATRQAMPDDGRGAIAVETAARAAPAPMGFPPPRGAPAAPMAKLAAAPSASRARSAGAPIGGLGGAEFVAAADSDEGGGGGAAPQPPELDAEPATGWLDFAGLRLAGPEVPAGRGKLLPGSDRAASDRASAAAAIQHLSPRERVSDPRESRGQFDHRYELSGRVDVPSDGLTHRVLLSRRDGAPSVRFRSVPRDDAQVFREAALINPFDSPLLAGPVEVYVEGSMLTNSALDRVDRGGALTVGMGAEERVRVARNVRTEEEGAGLLGGSVAVTHVVTIDLTSSLSAPAELELVDRIPVTDEKGVEVKLLASSPEAVPYKQEDRGRPVRGGLVWKLTLAPGEKKHVELRYRVTFSAKDELVGGNRRE